MAVDRDLFGAFILYKQWYGLYTKKRGMVSQVFLSKEFLIKEIQRVSRLRQRHNYRIMSDTTGHIDLI